MKDILGSFADAFQMPDPGTEDPTANLNPARLTASDPEAMYPCQCNCNCTLDSQMPARLVTSPAAAAWLQCPSCFEKGHNPDPVAAPPKPSAAGQSVHPGTRRGRDITVTKIVAPDDQTRARDLEIRDELRSAAWAEHEEKWLGRLPERFRKPMDGEPLEPAVEQALTRLQARDGTHHTSLLSLGRIGSGKTWVAYTYAREAVRRRLIWPYKIKILTEAELLGPLVLGDQWDRPRALAALLDRQRLEMLVIDDLGTYEGGKPEDRIAAYTHIVDWFYREQRSLVITTNGTLGSGDDGTPPGSIWQTMGARAYNRMGSMVGSHGIVVRDKDKRAEVTAQWEAEYRARAAQEGID